MRVTKANCYEVLEAMEQQEFQGYDLKSTRYVDYLPWSKSNVYYYAEYNGEKSNDCKSEEQTVLWVIKKAREKFGLTSKDLDKLVSGDFEGLLV